MRPTFLHIDIPALMHNFNEINKIAGSAKIIAMVKSNAYGCGLDHITQALTNQVGAFGVACLAEALAIRGFGLKDQCLIFQGVYTPDEWQIAAQHGFEVVLHHRPQLEWLLAKPLSKPVKIWLKMNTGMHRLGFSVNVFEELVAALKNCPWVDPSLGLMTHFACADEPEHELNVGQMQLWQKISKNWQGPLSACNSAASFSFSNVHGSHLRPGLILYGVSPFADKTVQELRFTPVMRYHSAIFVIHEFPANVSIGYGASYITPKPSRIGMVAVGYGDGYPRHVQPGTKVWINGQLAPIVGKISMDMMAVDITNCTGIQLGDLVELWGEHLPIEYVAKQANTIPYEIMCQVCPRERILDFYSKESRGV